MMRVIAGEFGGRVLRPPAGRNVRPTTDRVREAWFNILAPRLPGATVLDLFAGSGALGLEALSRGAVSVEFVELLPASLEVLKGNVESLGVAERVRIRRADALRFAGRLDPGAYDVAVADPPYVTDHAAQLLDIFRERPFAQILVLEHRAALTLAGDETRRYGDIALTFVHAP